MTLQMHLAGMTSYAKELHKVLLHTEWFLNIKDCWLPSCQVNLAELHQLVLVTTSSAGMKFLISGGIPVPNKHSGTDPCLAKYSTEHIYSLASCTDKVMASISSVIITFSFCGFTLEVKWYMDIRAKKRGYTGEVSVERGWGEENMRKGLSSSQVAGKEGKLHLLLSGSCFPHFCWLLVLPGSSLMFHQDHAVWRQLDLKCCWALQEKPLPTVVNGERWHSSGCIHPAALRAAAHNRGTAVSPLTFHPNIRVTISGKEYHLIL